MLKSFSFFSVNAFIFSQKIDFNYIFIQATEMWFLEKERKEKTKWKFKDKG